MAQDLNLLDDFTNGQGAGAGTYTGYAPDLDSNFSSIEATVNQINQEISAFGGANSTLVLDLIQSTDPAITDGRMGSNSFPATFQAADTQIVIGVGVALTAVQRIATGSGFTLTGSGGAGTRWVSLNADQTITLETAVAQGVLDLYSVTWDSAQFTTATLLQLDNNLVDGDDFQNSLITDGDAEGSDEAGLPAKTYDRIANRLKDLDKVLQGITTGEEGDALGRPAISGSAASPGLILTDGTSLVDATTGLFRSALNAIGFSNAGVLSMLLSAEGQRTSPTQGRASASVAADNIASGTALVNLALDTEQYDVGTYHDTVTNNDRMTVPTNYGGDYAVHATVTFDESTSSSPNTGDRAVAITVNGGVVAEARAPAAGANDSAGACSIDVRLSANDIVRVAAAQDSTGAMDVAARLTVRLAE